MLLHRKIFTDHYSDIRYLHLHTSLTYYKTVQSKKAFKFYIQKIGENMSNYYTVNIIFHDIEFMQTVRD